MLDYVVSKIHEQGPREEQQDALGMVKFGQSIRFIVIDGMGGTQSGKEAAERVLVAFQEKQPLELVAKKVHASFQSWLNEEFPDVDVHDLPGAVGTVLEIDLSTGDGLVYHLGDTRLYIGTNQGFEQITTEHVDASGKVIQDFGLQDIEPFIQPISVGPNIQFLLCTDGLYNALDDNDILDLSMFFKEEDVELIATALIEERAAKFTDNASGYIIRTLDRRPVVKVMTEGSGINNIWKYVAIGLFLGFLVSVLWSSCSTSQSVSNSTIPEPSQTGDNVKPAEMKKNNQGSNKPEQPPQENDSTNGVKEENPRSRNVNRALQNSARKQQATDSEMEE